MAGPSSRKSLAFAEFLDVSLLGAIVLLIGSSLLTPLEAGATPQTGGSAEQTVVGVALALRSLSGPPEMLGLLLAIVGGIMVLFGPLWWLVGRPLSRRGYL